MSEAVKFINRRKHVRFEPDPLTYALIDITTKQEDKDTFHPTHMGLIVQESHGGCALVISTKTGLKKGDHCLLKVGDLPVFYSEVRWIVKLDKDFIKAGFQYQE